MVYAWFTQGLRKVYAWFTHGLRNVLQLDCGYWESKDTKDDINAEIEDKFKKGYPKNNILFEDTQRAILFQDNQRFEVEITDNKNFLNLINKFISYQRAEVLEFNLAIEKFKTDLPSIVLALRELINKEAKENTNYKQKQEDFLKLCQSSINPDIQDKDIREMLIQHILTEEIFVSIFDNADYHRENNIANTLYELERSFFRGTTKQNLLNSIRFQVYL